MLSLLKPLSAFCFFGILLASCSQAPAPVLCPGEGQAHPSRAKNVQDSTPRSSGHGENWHAPDFGSSYAGSPIVDTNCLVSETSFPFSHVQVCVDSLLAAGNVEAAIPLLRMVVNSQNSLDDVGRNSILLARLLYRQGRTQEAATVLESFQVFKPQILAWMDSAEALDARMRQDAELRAQETHSLAKQISNLMVVKSNYRLVRSLTDSLRTFALSDSLRNWSLLQDSIALSRGVELLRTDLGRIHQLVWEAGKYDSARVLLARVQQSPPEALALLGVDSISAWIAKQETTDVAARDPKFWKTHDPQKVLTEARQLKTQAKWEAAAKLLQKLLQTSLRKEARQELSMVGEQYCTQSRQTAAEKFSKYRKDHKPQGLQVAVNALDRCLELFPETSARSKIIQNRALLVQEQSKMNSAGTP